MKRSLSLLTFLCIGLFHSVVSFCMTVYIPVKIINSTTKKTFSIREDIHKIGPLQYVYDENIKHGITSTYKMLPSSLEPKFANIIIEDTSIGKYMPGSTKTLDLLDFPAGGAIHIYDTNLPWNRMIYGWDAKILYPPTAERDGVVLPFRKEKIK